MRTLEVVTDVGVPSGIKELLFDRWCSSKNVDHDFGKLRQLLLLEEFKWGVSNEIKTYLSEQKVTL